MLLICTVKSGSRRYSN